MPFNHLIFCHSLLLLPAIFPSIRVFSNESALCIRWPKYWSFSFNISPSNEHPGLISFRMTGWISLQSKGILSLFQHYSSKASILLCSAFFLSFFPFIFSSWRLITLQYCSGFYSPILTSIRDHWKNHSLD